MKQTYRKVIIWLKTLPAPTANRPFYLMHRSVLTVVYNFIPRLRKAEIFRNRKLQYSKRILCHNPRLYQVDWHQGNLRRLSLMSSNNMIQLPPQILI